MTEKAYAYCRYSSHNQDDGWSIEAQKAAIQKYAKDNNMKVIKWFTDEAKTGRNTNRDGYQQMMSALENGSVKLLLIHKLDRFHRNAANQLHDLQKLNKLGVRLIATADALDSIDPSTKLLATIKSALAEEFSDNLSKETRKGLHEAAKFGLHCGGIPPFGFVLNEDRHLAIDETTAPAVRKIFEMYLADLGYTAILNWLDKNGYRTQKGNAFTKTAIHTILKNEKYAGIFTYDKASGKDENGRRNSHKIKEQYLRIPGGCPAIISEEDFQRVQKKMKNRRTITSSYSSKHYYPLNGKICNLDGVQYTGNVNHSNGKKYYQYRCVKSGGGKSVNADHLHTAVAFVMRELLLSDSKQDEILNVLNEYAENAWKQADAECRQLKQKKAALENRRNNLMELLENGRAKTSLLNRLEEIETEYNQISAEVEKSEQQKHTFTEGDFRRLKKQFIPYLISQPTLEAKRLIDAVINKVTISEEHAEIKFNHGISADQNTIEFFKGAY